MNKIFRKTTGLLVLLSIASAGSIWAAITPEEETLRLSKLLKPIDDSEWGRVAGPRIQERYSIEKTDTLWDISNRLFGDPRYWPKIWAINNYSITNPHYIQPGNMVAFMPGTGTSLPTVSLKDKDTGIDVATNQNSRLSDAEPRYKKRSQEWRNLPRQKWEQVDLKLPPEVDPLGFDRRNVIRFHTPQGFELRSFASTNAIDAIGEITGGRKEARNLGLGDSVYIDADQELQIGELYTVTDDPVTLESAYSNRSGYSYQNLADVKILGIRDGIYIGSIVKARGPVARGSYLIPHVPNAKNMQPIPGPSPLEATLMMDHRLSTFTSAQFKFAYVDRGTEDGIRPGMVFRAYQHDDPATQKQITSSDFIIDADAMVVQTSKTFSLVMVINSINLIFEDNPVVLLTDISDLLKNKRLYNITPDQKEIDKILDELDELDRMDPGGALGPGEERELRQLERWKGNENEEVDEELNDALDSEEGTEAEPAAPKTDDELNLDDTEESDMETAPADSGTPESEVTEPSSSGDDLDFDDSATEESVPSTDPQPSDSTPSTEDVTPSEPEAPAKSAPKDEELNDDSGFFEEQSPSDE